MITVTEHMRVSEDGWVEFTGMGQLKLLGAFQSLQWTGPKPHGLDYKKCGGNIGYTNKQACKVIESITTVNPRRGKKGKVCPPKIDGSKDALPQYLDWLFSQGTPKID